jgi:hypothetical protein
MDLRGSPATTALEPSSVEVPDAAAQHALRQLFQERGPGAQIIIKRRRRAPWSGTPAVGEVAAEDRPDDAELSPRAPRVFVVPGRTAQPAEQAQPEPPTEPASPVRVRRRRAEPHKPGKVVHIVVGPVQAEPASPAAAAGSTDALSLDVPADDPVTRLQLPAHDEYPAILASLGRIRRLLDDARQASQWRP